MGEDDPWRVLSRHVEAALFPHHAYGRPIIGYPDTLRALSPQAMRDYYARFYHPGNATLVVCGDFEPARALAAVRRRFGRIRGGVPFAQADCFRRKLEEPPGELRVNTSWDDAGQRLLLGWPTTPVGTEEDYTLDLAMTVLASGRMSRLWRRLVLDEGLATSLSASNDSRVEAGALWIFVECAQGVEPARLERAIDDELERLARERVAKAELERARALIRAGEAFDGETVSDVAEELGEWGVDLDWHAAFDGGERYERIDAAGLRDVAARFLRPERRVVGWCRPREKAAPAARTAARREMRPRAAKHVHGARKRRR